MKAFFTALTISILLPISLSAQEKWRGLEVMPEDDCSEYDRDDYSYPQSIEDKIVASLDDEIYGPYTGRYFSSDTLTDIEHIVAAKEGHRSGLCSASKKIRKKFANDLLNLTLAHQRVNRCQTGGKCDLDVSDWLPDINNCWYTDRIVKVKNKYSLSVDKDEVDVLEEILSSCESFDMVFLPKDYYQKFDALKMYDDNRSGKISCKEARNHEITPVRVWHPAYKFMKDANNDGVVC